MWCEGVLCVGVYEVWECMGCGSVWSVETYGVWKCLDALWECMGLWECMECGSVSLIFKRALQPFNIKGPLKKIPRWKKRGKS